MAETEPSTQNTQDNTSMRFAVKEVWSLAWPTILTMTSFTVMQFTDRLMVGQIGKVEIAAQGNAGTWAFAAIATIMGIVTVVNTYVSQHLGANEPKKGSKYPWNAGWMALACWIVFIVPCVFIVPTIFETINPEASDAKLVSLESMYAIYMLMGSLFLLTGRGFTQYFLGMHMPKVITVSTIMANIVNVTANYILIFGEDGVDGLLPGIPGTPALGLQGAAIATAIGMFMETIIPFAIFIGPKFNAKYATRQGWKPCLKTIKAIFKIGWPGSMQWGNEIICWALFMTVFVGHYGTNDMAAGWIALAFLQLSFMPAVGINVAINSIVGKYIGAKKPDIAVSRARVGVAIAMAYMTICATIFVIFRYEFIEMFISSDQYTAESRAEIIQLGANMLIVVAVFQTVDALGIVYTGALRGAGDTVFPGIVTAIYSWVFIVGGGWVAITFFPQLGSIGPWIAASIYIILIGLT
ncbi:MAG: MATE family efflux transporter, partial [Planctomycetes bacterium]|nr:MATE family efflux transporter [Planctomycetota bacterium]